MTSLKHFGPDVMEQFSARCDKLVDKDYSEVCFKWGYMNREERAILLCLILQYKEVAAEVEGKEFIYHLSDHEFCGGVLFLMEGGFLKFTMHDNGVVEVDVYNDDDAPKVLN